MAHSTDYVSRESISFPLNGGRRKPVSQARLDGGMANIASQITSALSPAPTQPAPRRDEQLVLAAQSGCPAAYSELFNLYSQRVYRSVLAITKNAEDAEDAMQDSFLRAFLALRHFEGRSSFYSWVTRIAMNSALMILRKRRCRTEISLNPAPEWDDEIAPMDFKDPSLDPEQTCELNQRQAKLVRAIGRLSPQLREVVQARMSGECSVNEVAERLNISVAAAKSRLYRARLRLCAMTSVHYGPKARAAGSDLSIAFQA